jgi:hypothetical protein
VPKDDHSVSSSNVHYFSIIPEWILDSPELSHGAVRLYGILARYSDKEGISWPSRTTLAKRLSCTSITVDRWASQLVKVEALTITRRKSKSNENLTNIWKIYRVPTSVLLPGVIDVTGVGSSMLHRTRTKELEPKKKGTQLLDDLIEKEENDD